MKLKLKIFVFFVMLMLIKHNEDIFVIFQQIISQNSIMRILMNKKKLWKLKKINHNCIKWKKN